MKKRVAWLLERELYATTEVLKKYLQDFNVDFFRTPVKVLKNLNNGYALFIFGLDCPLIPYKFNEPSGNLSTGFMLSDDIRLTPSTQDTPVLIAAMNVNHYKNQIEAKGLDYLDMSHEQEKITETVSRMISV